MNLKFYLKYVGILCFFTLSNSFLISKVRNFFDFSFLKSEGILNPDFSEASNEDIEKINTDISLHWYVIGESNRFPSNRIKKITVWEKDYTVWKDSKTNTFYAMDDDCSHKGAALSGGYLKDGCAVCPYHGYEFAGNGTLMKVPGLEFTNTPCKNQMTYPIVEKNGWIYLNTLPKDITHSMNDNTLYANSIPEEEEARNPDFSTIFLNVFFKAYSRIVSENSLDVMHIGYVHTFGNRDFPSPIHEIPPFPLSNHHWRTEYDYLSGKKSFAKKLFGVNQLKIQNEFALPHMTVARILFGPWISTVVTFATPMNMTHTQLFVKTYRNFWRAPINSQNPLEKIYKSLGDYFTYKLMYETVMQDKSVVENIPLKKADGKFNMKYDKLSNTYRTQYKRLIHSVV